MTGAIPPLPQYALMAWYLVKHRDNFTFTSHLFNTFNIRSSLKVKNEVSHPYKTTDKIIV
jgi:hypothetical protein